MVRLVLAGGPLVLVDLSFALRGFGAQLGDDVGMFGGHVLRLTEIRGEVVERELTGIGLRSRGFPCLLLLLGGVLRPLRAFGAALGGVHQAPDAYPSENLMPGDIRASMCGVWK